MQLRTLEEDEPMSIIPPWKPKLSKPNFCQLRQLSASISILLRLLPSGKLIISWHPSLYIPIPLLPILLVISNTYKKTAGATSSETPSEKKKWKRIPPETS